MFGKKNSKKMKIVFENLSLKKANVKQYLSEL